MSLSGGAVRLKNAFIPTEQSGFFAPVGSTRSIRTSTRHTVLLLMRMRFALPTQHTVEKAFAGEQNLLLKGSAIHWCLGMKSQSSSDDGGDHFLICCPQKEAPCLTTAAMATTTASTFSGSFITENFAEDVRQTVGLFAVCAVNAVCFPAIRELTVDFLLDETEDVTSPVLAATTETTMQQLYFQFSCVYGRLALLLPPVCVYLVRQVLPTSRLPISRIVEAFVLVLAIFAVAFPVFWIVARQTTLQHLDKCDARDPQVTTAFNAFYCNARATELCAYKGPSQNQIHLDKLVKVFNGGNAVANDSQELMLDVFLGCRSTLVANKGGVSSLQAAFLKSSSTSDAADEWCGRSILSKTTGSGSFGNDLHSLATSSSPASINDAKSDLFVSAWRSQFVFDAVILTVISVFVLAFCWSWLPVPTAHKRGGGGRNALSGSRSRDGDELLHEAKHAFANATARSDGQKAD